MSSKRLDRLGLATFFVALGLGSAGLIYSRVTSVPLAVDLDSLSSQFCLQPPDAAHVGKSDLIDRTFDVVVPQVVQQPGVRPRVSFHVVKGEAIRLVVVSSRTGTIGVHGLSDIVPVRAGERIKISFRAIHTGRLAMQFHGVDGSHEEVCCLEVT